MNVAGLPSATVIQAPVGVRLLRQVYPPFKRTSCNRYWPAGSLTVPSGLLNLSVWPSLRRRIRQSTYLPSSFNSPGTDVWPCALQRQDPMPRNSRIVLSERTSLNFAVRANIVFLTCCSVPASLHYRRSKVFFLTKKPKKQIFPIAVVSLSQARYSQKLSPFENPA